jgi:spermidine synthase
MPDTNPPTVLGEPRESTLVRSPAILAQRFFREKRVLFGVTIFLGAFLLFQVQLIIGKYILPWFGGTPSVWTACMLMFQILLLTGYAYAHGISQYLSRKMQTAVHVTVVLFSLGLMAWLATQWNSPITPGANWKPVANQTPTWQIVRFLLVAVATPFFVLSTTGPLVQNWFVRVRPGKSPYRLYALSNLGSLLGLISYPFLVEPHFTIRKQAWFWSGGYLAYALACLVCAFLGGLVENEPPAVESSANADKPSWSSRLLWLSLAACASTMLLATTNVICQQVAVIPFLWVLPLCLYLISFILCFEGGRWYQRSVFHPLYFLAAAGACALLLEGPDASVVLQLVAYPALLFICCMVCHGEVAKLKPAPAHLTEFYLWIAAGGVLGGAYVSLLAPNVFVDFWEFHTAILGTGVLLLMTVRQDATSWWSVPVRWFPHRVSRILSVAALVALAVGFLVDGNLKSLSVLRRARNFYGTVAVVRQNSQLGTYFFLRDHMTNHGTQFQDPRLVNQPTGYYGPESGVGLLMTSHARPIRVGLIGLGTGTLAAYGKSGDLFRFYEINPAVVNLSSGPDAFFTYLRNTPADSQVILGDARLSLEREAARGEVQKFDILVLDAFSGDAIPMHLLTKEAFELYLKHLRAPDSVIAVHISNLSLDLSQVVAGLGREFNLASVRIYRPWRPAFSAKTDWIVMARDRQALRAPAIVEAGTKLEYEGRVPVWTDEYSNLLSALRRRPTDTKPRTQ